MQIYYRCFSPNSKTVLYSLNVDELKKDQHLKKGAILVDGVILNGPLLDAKAGEKFIEDAFPIIMEDAIRKATDVNEKVPNLRSLSSVNTRYQKTIKSFWRYGWRMAFHLKIILHF